MIEHNSARLHGLSNLDILFWCASTQRFYPAEPCDYHNLKHLTEWRSVCWILLHLTRLEKRQQKGAMFCSFASLSINDTVLEKETCFGYGQFSASIVLHFRPREPNLRFETTDENYAGAHGMFMWLSPSPNSSSCLWMSWVFGGEIRSKVHIDMRYEKNSSKCLPMDSRLLWTSRHACFCSQKR
jgi:hypothetical protein